MSKHTPGPWKIGYIGGFHDEFTAGPARGIGREEDACLIAAAPTMFDTLVRIVEQIETLDIDNPKDSNELLRAIVMGARQAIMGAQ